MNTKIKEKIETIKPSTWIEKAKLKLLECKNKYSHLVKPFIILFIIYTLAISSILRANFNYIDDTNRVVFGLRGYRDFSRFVTEYLTILVHTSGQLSDISPLSQLIAVCFLSLASVIILHLFKREEKITIMNIISVLPLGLCPYFLECLSYKFDSPYMALSILASTIPFLFYGTTKRQKINYALATFIGTLIMCTTYQASSAVVPLICLFYAFKLWNEKKSKESLQFILITCGSFLAGILYFQKMLMIPVEGYVSTSIFPLTKMIPGFFQNLRTYYSLVKLDFRILWLLLIAILSVSYLLVARKETKQNKNVATLLAVLVLLISVCLAFGLYPALEVPLFSPRGMYGIGILIALISVNATNTSKQYLAKLSAIYLSWCFIIFATIYGNCLSEQKRYIDFRVQSVVNELKSLEIMKTDTIKTIRITGNAGYAPSIENNANGARHLIKRLIPQTFGGNWIWHQAYFENYFNIKNIFMDYNQEAIPENLQTVSDTMYAEIQTNGEDYVLIIVK